MREYPRLNKGGSGARFRKTCMLCKRHFNKELNGHYQTPCIEWSYFRGDDSVLNVCRDCNRVLTLEKAIELDRERRT